MGSKSREAAARLTDMDTGHSGASVATVTDVEADLLELDDPLLTEQDNGEDEGESEQASPEDATPTELSDEPVEEETPVDDNAPEETDPSIEEGLAEDALLAAGGGGHHGPPTAIITGSSNVFINGLPAARQGDMLAPHHPGTRTITEGSGSVLINGMPAARVTDAVDCGGTIATGSSNVFIGDNPVLVAPSDASLPDIEFDHHRTRKPRSTNNTASQSEVSSQVDSVSYNPSDHAHTNDTHVRVEPVASNLGSVTWVGDSAAGDPASWGETYGDTLKTMLDDTIQTQADLANQTRGWGNVMQPLFKPIAGLGAAVGNTVGLLEGLSPKGLSPQVKNYWADQLSGIQQVAKLIGNAAQGDPAAAAQLTPAILTGAAFKKLGKPAKNTDVQAQTNTKLPPPFEELHNQDMEVEVKRGSFKTSRDVDIQDLSITDTSAARALDIQGWDDDKIEEILSSGDKFKTKEFYAGDKLYGFDTAGRNKNIKTSAYWVDEVEYGKLKSKHFNGKKWNKEGIKNTLALPCYNRADNVSVVEIQRKTIAVQSTVGKASELIKYSDSSGYNTGMIGKIMPGGATQTSVSPSTLKVLEK